MRFNRIGGVMLSSLDMDDFSGMFCTGDVYPLLHAIHDQLIAPLPKYQRTRPGNRMKNTKIDTITAQPTTTTTSTKEVTTSIEYPTTYYIYYDETTAETSTESSVAFTTGRGKISETTHLQQKADVMTADRTIFIPGSKSDHLLSSQETHLEAFDKNMKLQPSTIPEPANERLHGLKNIHVLPTDVTTGTLQVQFKRPQQTTVEQKTHLHTTTSMAPVNEPVHDAELRNFLKQAANLPSHRLINGIMKLLSASGTGMTKSSSTSISMLQKAKATTTIEPVVRTHENEPGFLIPDLKPQLNNGKTNTISFNRGNRHEIPTDRTRINQRLVDIDGSFSPGQPGKDRRSFIMTDMFVLPSQQRNHKSNTSPAKITQHNEVNKPKQLIPPPFPLPEQKVTRPSKSFLDMKDLGFLIG